MGRMIIDELLATAGTAVHPHLASDTRYIVLRCGDRRHRETRYSWSLP